jgi:hypothetical protein
MCKPHKGNGMSYEKVSIRGFGAIRARIFAARDIRDRE